MTTADIDLTLYFRKKHTPPPSVLILRLPNDKPSKKEQQRRISPTVELRSRQQKTHQATSNMNALHINNSDVHELSATSYGWQRHTDKINQVAAAPDVAYKNTYLDEPKREKSAVINADYRSRLSNSRSPSPRSQHSQQQLSRVKTASSASYNTSTSSQRKQYQQYRTVYDYIRQSIKEIERQRNLKQQNFSTRIKRPQNDDVVLRRVLGEKKLPTTPKIYKNHPGNPENLVNYINHSRDQIRVLHTTTPSHLYQQQQQTNHKYNRQPTSTSHNQTDSPDKQRTILMATATVGNS